MLASLVRNAFRQRLLLRETTFFHRCDMSASLGYANVESGGNRYYRAPMSTSTTTADDDIDKPPPQSKLGQGGLSKRASPGTGDTRATDLKPGLNRRPGWTWGEPTSVHRKEQNKRGRVRKKSESDSSSFDANRGGRQKGRSAAKASTKDEFVLTEPLRADPLMSVRYVHPGTASSRGSRSGTKSSQSKKHSKSIAKAPRLILSAGRRPSFLGMPMRAREVEKYVFKTSEVLLAEDNLELPTVDERPLEKTRKSLKMLSVSDKEFDEYKEAVVRKIQRQILREEARTPDLLELLETFNPKEEYLREIAISKLKTLQENPSVPNESKVKTAKQFLMELAAL